VTTSPGCTTISSLTGLRLPPMGSARNLIVPPRTRCRGIVNVLVEFPVANPSRILCPPFTAYTTMSLNPWFRTSTMADSAGSGPASCERPAHADTKSRMRDARRKVAMEIPSEDAGSGPVVVPYREELRGAFEELNREWIEAHFTLEPADREVLDDPRGKILEPGGQVLFVLEGGEVKGTCAVLRHSREECEIAKMAVAPAARGRGFGDLLMVACIAFARSIGAHRITILSNTVLEPAIRLYRKHGFVPVPFAADPRFQRANIRLELQLGPMAPASHPESAAR
jgi:putative acetyltransferase